MPRSRSPAPSSVVLPQPRRGRPDRDQRLRYRKEQHDLHARNRTPYGITDGQAYQDLDNPGAATFHIRADDIDTAMAWFRSYTKKHPS